MSTKVIKEGNVTTTIMDLTNGVGDKSAEVRESIQYLIMLYQNSSSKKFWRRQELKNALCPSFLYVRLSVCHFSCLQEISKESSGKQLYPSRPQALFKSHKVGEPKILRLVSQIFNAFA